MPNDQLSDYLSWRRTVKRWLLVVGIWPKVKRSIWYRSLPILQITVHSLLAMTISSFIRKYSHNIDFVIYAASPLISISGSLIKATSIFMSRKDIEKLHQILDPHFTKLINDPNLSEIILNELGIFRRLSSMLNISTYIFGILYVTKPIIVVIYMHLHHIYPIQYILINPQIFPWKITSNGLLYKFHYALDILATILGFSVAAGVDLLFGLYISQMIAQLIEMSHRISQLDSSENENTKIIAECMSQYGILTECRDILNKVYGPIVLYTMLTNAGGICSQMFQICKVQNLAIQKILIPLVFISFKLFQTFLYAFGGSRLTQESEKYKAAIYACKWQGDKHLMSSIVIMLAKKPVVLTAWSFTDISINLFMQVVNTSLSYFFLLQTLQDKNT
uniref:Odorant receptor n=1 Tax=Aulacocentrum confusum TaxID=2767324 RepID=A0A7G8Z953_9HYME|nr:olfactory receptor 34 [Aulacocentrum confusum]